MNKRNSIKQDHSSMAKIGSGDYYGTGIKAKIGTQKTDYLNDIIPKKKMKNVPKSLA